MHTAIVKEWGSTPTYEEVDDPKPSPDQVIVRITAAAVPPLVRARAAGKHFSATTLPHYPGADGVGVTEDGKPVYFNVFQTGGSLAEKVVLDKRVITPLPEGLDPVKAAVMVNPASASWMSYKTRVSNLPKDFTVVILGVTSTAGKAAIDISRYLGAKRVIGVARKGNHLDALSSKLDETIAMAEDPAHTDFSKVIDVDVVLDYLYGPVVTAFLSAIKVTRPLQYVQIGSLTGDVPLPIPSQILRSKDITIRGSAPGAYPPAATGQQMPALLEALKKVDEIEVEKIPLEKINETWDGNYGGKRVVYVV